MDDARFEAMRRLMVGAVVVGALVFLVTLLPGVRPREGYLTPLDGWLQGSVYALMAGSAVLAVALRDRDRWFWGLVAAAVTLRTLGFEVYWAWIRTQVPQPYPSLADLFWILSALALVAALVWAAAHVSAGMTRVLALDALVAGLASAGVALAVVYPTLDRLAHQGAPSNVVATNLVYPVLDMVVVVGVVGLAVTIRSQASAALRLALAGMVGYSVVDAVFLYQVVTGTFRPGSWLGGLSLVSTAALAVSPWFARSSAEVRTRIGRLQHTSLAVPIVFATAATGIFLYDAVREVPTAPMLLGVAALFVAMLRGTNTFARERSESREVIRATDDERVKFQALVEASGDLIAIADLDGRVTYVNPAGRAMVGLAADRDVRDTTIADYFTEESNRYSEDVSRPAVLERGHWEGEMMVQDHRGGPATPVAVSSFLMKHPDTGEPIAMGTVQRDISDRVAASRALEQLAEQRALLLDRLVRAEEAERARIAADVHDDSVQALAVVDLRLGLLTNQLGQQSASADQHRQTLRELRTAVTQASERLRQLLFDLEQPTAEVDLPTAVGDAAAHLFRGTDIAWRITGDGGPELSDSVRATAYRIAKEAMVNVLKHAAAGKVEIRVQGEDGDLVLAVTDDGRGFEPGERRARPGHLGLDGMADRATVAGGRLEVDSAPGQGTAVRLWLPALGPETRAEAKK